jgi:hypothetical protein
MDAVSALRTAQTFLESVHPATPWALLTAACWGAVYGVRRWAPGVWARLEAFGPEATPAARVFQALPSIMAGALVGVALTGGDYHQAWKGAASGALAPLIHHVMKSYRGAVGRGIQ